MEKTGARRQLVTKLCGSTMFWGVVRRVQHSGAALQCASGTHKVQQQRGEAAHRQHDEVQHLGSARGAGGTGKFPGNTRKQQAKSVKRATTLCKRRIAAKFHRMRQWNTQCSVSRVVAGGQHSVGTCGRDSGSDSDSGGVGP